MKTVVIRALYLAFVAVWSSIPDTAVAKTKSQYGGFSPDSLQVFYEYIHGQEMMRVETGPQLKKAVDAVPVDLGALIDLKQEAELRNWLYEFLVAFSSSGNDSLAAAFYLREGTNNPDMVERLKKFTESKGSPKGDTPFAVFRAGHRYILDATNRDYFFENVSFFDSVFKVFEMQEAYDSYAIYLKTHGMVPKGTLNFRPKLQKEVEEALQEGEQRLFADIMFIVEEPEGVSPWEWQGRTPVFFRLIWDPERAMWRHVEVYFSAGVPQSFLFHIM